MVSTPERPATSRTAGARESAESRILMMREEGGTAAVRPLATADLFCLRGDAVQSVAFERGLLRLLDQRALPEAETYVLLRDARAAQRAIADMVVRGAPAIGLAAAYAVALAAREAANGPHPQATLDALCEAIASARPTAINLRREVKAARRQLPAEPKGWYEAALRHADELRQAQVREDAAMAEHALPLFRPGMRVLTHCNTGALATGGRGTALGAIINAHEHLGLREVLVDETRPRLQGARLTAFELQRAGVPHRLIVDGAAAHCMAQGLVDLVILGADRIGRDGRVANKIGTYSLAVLARHHGIPFAVVAPRSSCDGSWDGDVEVEIEQRPAQEVLQIGREALAPPGSTAYNPAFDVTPGALVDAVVREDGLHRPPYALD